MKLFLLSVLFISKVNGEELTILTHSRIQALKSLAQDVWQLNRTSFQENRLPCNSFYDYVCGGNFHVHSILGSPPKLEDLVKLYNYIERYPETGLEDISASFVNFFISCSKLKSVDECYLESFEYFKPMYAQVISKNFLDQNYLYLFDDIFAKFLNDTKSMKNDKLNSMIYHLDYIRYKILSLNIVYLPKEDINKTYSELTMFRGNYNHNLKILENFLKHPKMNQSLFDFIIYLYKQQDMPRSYIFSTLNVHLWMSVFNLTKTSSNSYGCFEMPSYITNIKEARIFADIYYKSFLKSWNEYEYYSIYSENILKYEEDQILKEKNVTNDELFFVFYGQNFCHFGKEIAENVFYQGLRQDRNHFHKIYHCSDESLMNSKNKCANVL